MRKRITDRLSYKVFIITFSVQVLFGVLIYFLLYNATPLSWNTVRRADMESRFESFTGELSQVSFAECGPLIDDFVLSNDCHIVFYKGDSFEWADLPVTVPGSEYVIRTRWDVMKLINLENTEEMSLSTSARVEFNQEKNRVYTVVCLWSQHGENVLSEALKGTLPLIFAAIVLVSLICSYIYAYLFARPVRKLSEISEKIADMDFTAKSGSTRRDEIGDLGRNLDNLSSSLDETITNLNERTRELEHEINRVNEMEKQKEMFFLAASHELKTPITVAQGHVNGMIDGVAPYDDIDTYLPKTLSSLKRMESLINEILTVSRMQADNEIERKTENMGAILRSRIDSIKELLDVRDISLETQIEDGLVFEGNSELVSMAIGAFLSNSVFYSSDGSKIVVSAFKNEGKIVTEIRNTNSHIDEKDLPHLFEAFYRADSSRSRRNGGSGLGLYLGKLIIERHNGTVSLVNDGSDVLATIILPLFT
ncbi:MAG: HAMP domain-containing histidine kinase [Saccharofermentans sp.]|nr:HAMP domain-containing histidine kinase [Saccharofermentans sp.]